MTHLRLLTLNGPLENRVEALRALETTIDNVYPKLGSPSRVDAYDAFEFVANNDGDKVAEAITTLPSGFGVAAASVLAAAHKHRAVLAIEPTPAPVAAPTTSRRPGKHSPHSPRSGHDLACD